MTYMTIEQFRQIHEDWKQSGLSVQQYCENTGLTESRFYYWKSKLKAESLPSACGSFIPEDHRDGSFDQLSYKPYVLRAS